MEPNELHINEQSEENLEKISIKPLLYLSSLIALAVFLVTFMPYSILKINLLPFFSFNFSYIFSYLILFLLIFIVLIFYYRHKSVHMEELSQYVTIFGVYPAWLINRTGNRPYDWYGLGIGIILSVCSFLYTPATRYSPGFLFLTLSFLFALMLGSSKKWKLIRRR